jgi:RNAse (barnase) inhibitor barstar
MVATIKTAKTDFYKAIAVMALSFPAYFGENLDALL